MVIAGGVLSNVVALGSSTFGIVVGRLLSWHQFLSQYSEHLSKAEM